MNKAKTIFTLTVLLLCLQQNTQAQSGIIAIIPTETPLAQLPAGSHRVSFEFWADEMVTLWHTDSYGFLFVAWDVFEWQPAEVTFETTAPVTLYVEGFGCAAVCGELRSLEIESWPPEHKMYLPLLFKN